MSRTVFIRSEASNLDFPIAQRMGQTFSQRVYLGTVCQFVSKCNSKIHAVSAMPPQQ